MKGIILAAGGGSRLRPLTDSQPKCLVEVNGIPIIENALRALRSAGCDEATIAVGYKAEVLQQRLGAHHHGIAIDYVTNERWASTNSMFSLLVALERGPARYVIEGDVFFDAALLQHPAPEDILWLVDGTYRSSDGCYLSVDPDGFVSKQEIVKRPLELSSDWAKSVGVLGLSDRGASKLRQWLEVAAAQQKHNLYYDLIIAEHLAERAVRASDVAPSRWYEIDTPEDLASAERLFA